MKVIFVHHSCFVVEMEDVVLIFDYFEGNRVTGYTFTGVLPVFDKDKSIYFFASHKHQDHFDMNILKLAEDYEDIHFILSKDTKMSPNFMKKHGIPERAKKCIEYVIPDKKYEIGKVKVKTLRSTDAGVAFLVKTCGKTIYHAGDLHNWKMEHVGELINGKMERDYRQQIRKLEGEYINVAFVVLDPRLGEYTDLGLAYFMKNVEADYVFPMHMWQDYSAIEKYKQKCDNHLYTDRIMDIEKENQVFDMDNLK